MATITSPFPIKGPLGDLVFAKNGNKTTLRYKPTINKQRYETHRRYKRVRENAQSFGGASKTACAIYSAIAKGKKHMFAPYSHNKLIKKLKQAAERDQRVVSEYTFKKAMPPLRNLDMSHKGAPSELVKPTPLGSVHNPDSIRVTGLREAAARIQRNGNGRLEMRIGLHFVRFPATRYDKESKEWEFTRTKDARLGRRESKGWIPVDILPEEGLLLSLQNPRDSDPEIPVLKFILLEWREVREVGDEIKPLHEMAVVRLAAMQYTEAMAAEIASDESAQTKEKAPSGPPLWQTDPKAFLAAALGGLATEPPT